MVSFSIEVGYDQDGSGIYTIVPRLGYRERGLRIDEYQFNPQEAVESMIAREPFTPGQYNTARRTAEGMVTDLVAMPVETDSQQEFDYADGQLGTPIEDDASQTFDTPFELGSNSTDFIDDINNRRDNC